MRELLVHGMFRSGTTLLSRMLSARPRNLLATDPFVYFFKAYRNFYLERHATSAWTADEPTSDHFLSPHHAVHRQIARADLSEAMPRVHLERMVANIRHWKAEQHPRLCQRLDELEAGTFAQVYRRLIELCVELYGSQATEVAGAKLSWCDEFLPALGRAFPEMHFVLLVRDLRAVVASQNSQYNVGIGKRPLLFYIRHWRKSVAFAQHFAKQHPELRERTHLIRYEDLVTAPQETLEALCSTAPIEFAPCMLEPDRYRSVSEDSAWKPNSSFAPGRGIYRDSLERWRGILSEDQVRTINALAGPELGWLGYELPTQVDHPQELRGLGGEPTSEELPAWIRPFACCDYLRDPAARERELAVEEDRRAILEDTRPAGDDVARMFPAPETLAELRKAWQRCS